MYFYRPRTHSDFRLERLIHVTMSFPPQLCLHKSDPLLNHQLKGMRTSMRNQGLDDETADRRNPLSCINSNLLRTRVCEVTPIKGINTTNDDEIEDVPDSPSSPMVASSCLDEAEQGRPRLTPLAKRRRSQLQESDKILYVESCDILLLPKFPLLPFSTTEISSPIFPKQKQTLTKKVDQLARHFSHPPIPSAIRLLPKKRKVAFRNLPFDLDDHTKETNPHESTTVPNDNHCVTLL